MARPLEVPRYARLAETAWIGRAGLAKLRRSTVVVLGVGNVGGQLSPHFAMLGCDLVLVDRDVVTASNLGTQGFSTREDVGVSKVEARARALESLNDTCGVKAILADIAAIGMGVLRDADLMFSCLDNRRGRVVVNEIATRLGIPWIDVAVDGTGTMMLGRVAAYDTTNPRSACYVCPHDGESLHEIATEGAPPGCPVLDPAAPPPTLAISALGGVVAATAVVTGLKLLLGKPVGAVSRESFVDLDRMALDSHALKRNPDCLLDHGPFVLTPLEGAPTVGATFDLAVKKLGGEPSLQLQRRSLVGKMRCPACGQERELHRVLETLDSRERACACRALMMPLAGSGIDRLTREDAEELRHRTWTELGVPPEDVIVASNGDAEIAFLLPPQK